MVLLCSEIDNSKRYQPITCVDCTGRHELILFADLLHGSYLFIDTVGNSTESTTVDGINLDEIKEFAKQFKIRRLSLGLTQTQVGQALSATEGPAYSQSAICRYSFSLNAQALLCSVCYLPIICRECSWFYFLPSLDL